MTIPPQSVPDDLKKYKSMGTIYLIHFNEKYKHAQHYLGWAGPGNLNARLEHHRNGNGARLMAAVSKAGIEWKVVRLWRGSRVTERIMKQNGAVGKYCPICHERPRGTQRPEIIQEVP
jgi:hypothetical protein